MSGGSGTEGPGDTAQGHSTEAGGLHLEAGGGLCYPSAEAADSWGGGAGREDPGPGERDPAGGVPCAQPPRQSAAPSHGKQPLCAYLPVCIQVPVSVYLYLLALYSPSFIARRVTVISQSSPANLAQGRQPPHKVRHRGMVSSHSGPDWLGVPQCTLLWGLLGRAGNR